MLKVCACGSTYVPTGSRRRCPACAREYERARRRGTNEQRNLGRSHRLMRERVLREEKLCWICGVPARAGDPLTADHVVPRAAGGTNDRSNYRAAHASCNSRRGNDVRWGASPTRKTRPEPAFPVFRETQTREVDAPLVG